MIGWEQIIFRIFLGTVLGGLVGLEREVRGQAAGFRTHTLVAMGATLFTLVSFYGFQSIAGSLGTSIDPSRIASQIVVGIGFLGAGAIFRHGTSVKGLTTAASLWVVAAMGLSVGAGFYVGSITVALLLLVVLRGLRPTEYILAKWVYPDEASLTILIDPGVVDTTEFIDDLRKHNINVRDMNKVMASAEHVSLTMGVRLTKREMAQEVVEKIRNMKGVRQVRWER